MQTTLKRAALGVGVPVTLLMAWFSCNEPDTPPPPQRVPLKFFLGFGWAFTALTVVAAGYGHRRGRIEATPSVVQQVSDSIGLLGLVRSGR
jgi:hypothetical protein